MFMKLSDKKVKYFVCNNLFEEKSVVKETFKVSCHPKINY